MAAFQNSQAVLRRCMQTLGTKLLLKGGKHPTFGCPAGRGRIPSRFSPLWCSELLSPVVVVGQATLPGSAKGLEIFL